MINYIKIVIKAQNGSSNESHVNSLQKHGWGKAEFLINTSYPDKVNILPMLQMTVIMTILIVYQMNHQHNA